MSVRVKRRSRAAHMDRHHVRAAYRLYRAGLSVRGIADLVWERFGYANRNACADCLLRAFKLEGYQLRDRGTAAAMANTTHGLTRTPAYNELRRRRDREHGRIRGVRCSAARTKAPGRGTPCRNYALRDSDVCYHHDPRYRDTLRAQLAPHVFGAERKQSQIAEKIAA